MRRRLQPFLNQKLIGQCISLACHQRVLHKPAKPRDIPLCCRIIGGDQNRFTFFHFPHFQTHHHHRFRATEAQCVQFVIRAGEERIIRSHMTHGTDGLTPCALRAHRFLPDKQLRHSETRWKQPVYQNHVPLPE